MKAYEVSVRFEEQPNKYMFVVIGRFQTAK